MADEEENEEALLLMLLLRKRRWQKERQPRSCYLLGKRNLHEEKTKRRLAQSCA